MGFFAALLRFVALIPVSLLPERWRQRLGAGDASLAVPTLLTAFATLTLAVLLWWDRYAAYRFAAYERTGDLPGGGAAAPAFVYGASLYVGFFFTGWGVLVLAIFLEGCARLAASFAGVPLGLSVLGAGDLLLQVAEQRAARPRLGPHVADEVTRAGDGGDLTIATWRPREWDALSTVGFEDALYQLVAAEERVEGPRRFVYRLRRAAPDHLVRRVDPYVPDPGPTATTRLRK